MSIFIHEITCFINSDKLLEKNNINRKKALKIVKGLEVNAVELRKKIISRRLAFLPRWLSPPRKTAIDKERTTKVYRSKNLYFQLAQVHHYILGNF
tara:strand:+ start:397 stop:684 length:288 start_codon:yes stop_codon:yes gene_type:complete